MARAKNMATATAIELPVEALGDDDLPLLKPWLCAGWKVPPPWEAESSLHGHLVEVHGLTDKIQAGWAKNPHMFLSAGADSGIEDVDGAEQNGKRGRAAQINQSMYSVETFDGEMLYVPSDNLMPYSRRQPEDGGFDFHWPAWEADSLEWFSGRVAEALDTKGFTVIQTFHSRELRRAMVDLAQQTEWSRLEPSFEEGFLGGHPASVAWISDNITEDEALRCTSLCLTDMCSLLSTWTKEGFGFTSMHEPGWLMLRQALLRDTRSKIEHDVGSPSSKIGVAHYLDFVQRRRICMMSVIESRGGGTIEFTPKAADSMWPKVSLPIMANRMILFRHDLLSYSFSPSRSDLVLQAWLMQQPPTIQVQHVTGDEGAVLATIGASQTALPRSSEAHVMAVGSVIPGETQGFNAAATMYFRGADAVVEVPQNRWDHNLYYSPDPADGMAVCKHTGFIHDNVICGFDPSFFGISYEDAAHLTKSSYKVLEVGFETLHSAGFVKETLRNAPIMTVHGNSARSDERCEREKSLDSRFSSHYLLSNLFNFFLGLAGPSSCVDTACSSSLVATQIVHQRLMQRRDGHAHNHIDASSITSGISMGSNVVNHPASYIGLSQANMMSSFGRSLTFDSSACGFTKGEAISCVYITLQDDAEAACNQIAALCGSASNQDGRSASITAPNGPSQQAAIRTSLEDAKRQLAEISVNELHGTGNQLGDPIEIGALRNCMGSEIDASQPPILYGAGKSLSGHCEFAAGSVALVKTMLACYHAAAPANLHLRQLNMHIDCEDTPAMYATEITDIGRDGICAGISSFGFGGTNARADIWAECRKTSRAIAPLGSLPGGKGAIAHVGKQAYSSKAINFEHLDIILLTCPECLGQMCWRCKEAYHPESDSNEQHCCTLIRDDLASYDCCSDCYRGGYKFSDAPAVDVDLGDPGRRVFVIGSWSDWQDYEEMSQKIDASGDGHYECTVRVDEARQARFRIILDKDTDQYIFPLVNDSSHKMKIGGPSSEAKERSWLIDGSADGAPPNTAYKIKFCWTTAGKTIMWQPASPLPTKSKTTKLGFKYSVVGSWSGWHSTEMNRMSKDGVVMWVATARIGLTGEEEFWIVQGHDRKDAIFPGGVKTTDMKDPIGSVAPNAAGHSWLITGVHGESVTIRLRVSETSMVLTTSGKSQGTRSWKTPAASRQARKQN